MILLVFLIPHLQFPETFSPLIRIVNKQTLKTEIAFGEETNTKIDAKTKLC